MTSVSVVWTRSPDLMDPVRLLTAEVSRVCGVDPSSVRLTRMCPWCGSDRHGRPHVVPRSDGTSTPSVSLSRSTHLAVAAVGFGGAVGVDAESIASFVDRTIADVLLHHAERADGPADLATTWVRKEALLKAAGCGLGVDPRLVRLTGAGAAAAVVDWPPFIAAPTWVQDLDLGSDVRAAVAGHGGPPVEVAVRNAGVAAPPG